MADESEVTVTEKGNGEFRTENGERPANGELSAEV